MGSKHVLHNIRILDFTWVLAGPYATRLLADFGAEVIKVLPVTAAADENEFSRGYYATWNRNKRAVTLNLDRREGIALARKLVGISDVVIENFTPRVMANWGLDYDNLKAIRPDVIVLGMSAFGHSGPDRNCAGFAPTVHAAAGLTGLTAFPGGPPLGPGFSYADHAAGLYASIAVLGALEHRRRTGEGQFIDISQAEAVTGLFGEKVVEFSMTGAEPEPAGNRSAKDAPHGVYPCRGENSWCAIAVDNDTAWQGFKIALGSPAWAEEAGFDTLESRLRHRRELDARVTAWTKQHTADGVMRRLQSHGVAAGVVQDAARLFRDPQLRARGFFVSSTEPGDFADASPVRMSETPAQYRFAAPTPGQDNEYVYRRLLGLADTELRELGAQGVIQPYQH